MRREEEESVKSGREKWVNVKREKGWQKEVVLVERLVWFGCCSSGLVS